MKSAAGRWRGPRSWPTAPPQQLRSPAQVGVADYVTLTKPRIMLLILITAYGAMAFAADGLPARRR